MCWKGKDTHYCNQRKIFFAAIKVYLKTRNKMGQNRKWWDHVYRVKVNDDNLNSGVSDKNFSGVDPYL